MSFISPANMKLAPLTAPLELEDSSYGNYIPSLSGLRGLAILLILIYHCFPDLYKFGAGIAWIGVDLSFVLSGFLITRNLLEDGNLSKFFMRRSVRILPAYFTLLLLFFVLFPLCTDMDWVWSYGFYYLHQVWYWLFGANLLIALRDHWPPVDKPILDHLWSICAIVQFYLLWPFLLKVFKTKNLLYISLLLMAGSVLLRNLFVSMGLNYSTSYVFTFARMDGLCLGAAVAIMIRETSTKKVLSHLAPKTIIISALGIVTTISLSRSLSLKDDYFIRFGYFAVNLFFSSLLVYALSSVPIIRKSLESSLLKWLGKYSYSIYVYHWFMYLFVAEKLNKLFAFLPHPLLTGLCSSLLSVALIMATSVASWHLIEKHFLKLKYNPS